MCTLSFINIKMTQGDKINESYKNNPKTVDGLSAGPCIDDFKLADPIRTGFIHYAIDVGIYKYITIRSWAIFTSTNFLQSWRHWNCDMYNHLDYYPNMCRVPVKYHPLCHRRTRIQLGIIPIHQLHFYNTITLENEDLRSTAYYPIRL